LLAKKNRKRTCASISDQYYAVYKKAQNDENNGIAPSYSTFNLKDKFLILHLTHLTSVKAGHQKIGSMEKELQESDILFACFRGDTQKFSHLLSQNPSRLSESLPSSKLNALHLSVASGNDHLVKYIVSCIQTTKALNIDMNTFNGLTALHLACLFGLSEISHTLISTGFADTNVTCTAVPFSPPYFQKPLSYWNSIKDCAVAFFTPFLYCIFGGSAETLQRLVVEGVALDQCRDNFLTDAVSLAAIMQHEEMIDIMLKREASKFNYDVNYSDPNGVTPIMFLSMSSGHGCKYYS